MNGDRIAFVSVAVFVAHNNEESGMKYVPVQATNGEAVGFALSYVVVRDVEIDHTMRRFGRSSNQEYNKICPHGLQA